ncbi:hypothetical protein CGLAMM_07220 [Acetobacteraceae bacterium EV16G]|uniref:Uncharacterized protein n=1 Tax=Sorlinia euscelidii TaxID=3081148 RepID=A0ABU7U5E9_9PROT
MNRVNLEQTSATLAQVGLGITSLAEIIACVGYRLEHAALTAHEAQMIGSALRDFSIVCASRGDAVLNAVEKLSEDLEGSPA